MKLDYNLIELEDRKALVQSILDSGEELTNQQLGYIADYLLFVADRKQTGKEKKENYPIVTKNRSVTINKRQVSYEETIDNLQNGEDGLYSIMLDNDKNRFLDNRSPITQEDIDTIPNMRENMEVIDNLKKQLETATGKRKFQIKQHIISKYKECYTLKSSFSNTIKKAHINAQLRHMAHMELPETVTLGEDGLPHSNGTITLLRADHVAFLLKYYSKLKQECWEDLDSDMHWMLIDLEKLVDAALLPDYEVLYDLLIWEIDGLTGTEIAAEMERKYGIVHSEQYFSTLWCKRIPKLVAEQAQKRWLIWYYTYKAPEEAQWKVCRTCGRKLLAHPLFFHKNTSKDGYYSKCRDCRSNKNK